MENIIRKEVWRWTGLGARPGVWYEVRGHYWSYRRYRSWLGVTIVTACQIDCNHHCLLEMKQVQSTHTFSCPTSPRTSNNLFTTPPTASAPLSTATPVDIDLSCHCIEDQTCYKCKKWGYISPAYPEPRKEQICAEQTPGTLEDMISKSVAY